jgi:hypothetical protein
MDEGGQEPVDEHEPVLRTGAHSTLPRPRGQLGLVTLMPQRANLGDEFSDHLGRQPVICRLRMIAARARLPTTQTMINDHSLDVPPLLIPNVVVNTAGTVRKTALARSRW